MKRVNEFFWWCAGANADVLRDCPTDHAKYFGVGGTIIFTALMAMFAGGYAFFTAFKSFSLAIPFGIFWGLLIFNLDRYIVSTIGKGDGTQKITFEEWKIATPRLLMAVLLGFVIATPLELKIFETEIQTVVERLKIDKAEELKSRDVSFNEKLIELKSRLATVEANLNELTNNKRELTENSGMYYEERKKEIIQDSKSKESELNAVQSQVNRYHGWYIAAIRDSLSETEINRRKATRDPYLVKRNKLRKEKEAIDNDIIKLSENRATAIKEEEQKIDRQITLLVDEKETLLGQKERMEKTGEGKAEGYIHVVENYNGFAAHLEAMKILTKEKREILWAKWLITLLFIFIEVAPVLFKLMAESGPYDDIMDRLKHESNVREKRKISDINDEINTSIKISTAKNQNRLDAELKSNAELMDKIAMAQAEIANEAVRKWKEEEMKKLESGVEHIINASGNG